MRRRLATAAVLLLTFGAAAAAQAPAPVPAATCAGNQKEIFNNSNTSGVRSGGKAPTFSTKGKAWCVLSIVTYHWNGGKGKAPGTIALGVVGGLGGSGKTLGPFKAKGSSGQDGARNVDWTVVIPRATPLIINGSYTCRDSHPATWAQNQQSKGKGFCHVWAQPALNAPEPPPKEEKPEKGAVPKGKLSITANPDTGKPPLKVTFTLRSPKVVQWRVDFGDGQSKLKTGSPPKTLEHTYRREGDFKPKLTVLADPKAKTASSATTGVSVHDEQLMRLTANPTSGPAPLKVTFSLGSTVKNIGSWAIAFGDGRRAGGEGKPPKSVSHTYEKDGNYRATFSVKPGATSAVSTFASITVGGGTPPVIGLSASPTSGKAPLPVKFTIGSNVPGPVVSWKLDFGDGQQQGGAGKPPASLSHTYAKKGNYAAYLVVVQQQTYGGVQYVAPKGGLRISAG